LVQAYPQVDKKHEKKLLLTYTLVLVCKSINKPKPWIKRKNLYDSWC